MEIERGIDPSDRSDTPETDAAVFDIPNYGADGTGSRVAVVHYQVAVRLERERDAAHARVAELESQPEKYQAIVFKARDILKCGHVDNVVGALQTLWTRYNGTMARIAMLEATQTQQPLDRPDRPGWWWCWSQVVGRWDLVDIWHTDMQRANLKGQWLPATPPPVPVMSEKEGAK